MLLPSNQKERYSVIDFKIGRLYIMSGRRIESRSDLNFFLQRDYWANDFDNSDIRSRIKQFLSPNPIISFLHALREAEYYTNCGGGICRIFWRLRLKRLSIKTGIQISVNTCGPGLSLPHYGNIIINSNASIGANCRIHVGVNIGASGGRKDAPQIGDNVYIGPGAILFGDITIGSNNLIGANATVNKSFTEENVVIAGTPAVVVKKDSKNWIELNGKE